MEKRVKVAGIEEQKIAPEMESYEIEVIDVSEEEDEGLPEEGVIEADTAGMPLLFPSQIASKFPKDRCVAVHARGIYMCANPSNRFVKDGDLEKPVGAQSILRKEIGKFCDAIFHEFPPPSEEVKKDYRNVLFTTRFRDDLAKELSLASLEPDMFDAGPMLLGIDRGHNRISAVLDLETKKIRDMQVSDYISRKCVTMPDWNMKTPAFDAFLLGVMSGEMDRVEFLLRFFGYALTGHTSEDALTFLLGSGGNGKSTVMDLLAYIIGRHYCLTRRTSVLLEKRGESNDDAQKRLNASLCGMRLFLADEANRNMKFDQALLKQLSTTSRLSGAHPYEKEFEFQATHTLVISLDKPPVLEGTRAMLRRLNLIEFRESFGQDPSLLPRLKREAPGIMAKLVDGCVEWQKHGLKAPESVKTAGKDLLSDGDIFGRWLTEQTEHAPGVDTPRDVLQNSFDAFRRGEKDQTPMKAAEFNHLFRCDQRYDRQARTYVKSVQVRAIGNIRLKANVEADKTDKTRIT